MARPAGDVDYGPLGSGYSRMRRADPRIAAVVHRALGASTTVVNVGAGTGAYEPVDRRVTAVEPSASMRAQRPGSSAPVVAAVAEALPFADDRFDGAMAMVTVHQWRDLGAGLGEMRRVARGPVVVLAFDPEAISGFWLDDYVPEVTAACRRRDPPIARVRDLLGSARVMPVPIPLDCTDGFIEAYYGRPERLLDPAVRAAQSTWQFVDPVSAESGLARLRTDLATGAWDRRHGALRRSPAYAGSLRLVVSDHS
jgi:hypothetical protein